MPSKLLHQTSLDLRRFQVLTFDCYGTLVDWEAGILAGMRPLLTRQDVTLTDEEVLERYGRYEAEIEAGPYRPYKDVLRGVVERFGADFGFAGHAERDVLIDTFAAWKPFPDTVAVLRQLQKHYKLAILSNVDDDLFAITAAQLEVPFDAVLTAEQIGSYKPSPRNFAYAQRRLGMTNAGHLHVAQSLYHDITPARSLGISTVWVNRRHDSKGAGATPPIEAQPDLEVPDLQTLAELVAQAFALTADTNILRES